MAREPCKSQRKWGSKILAYKIIRHVNENLDFS